jgi:8-oxo-dGTP pyrophosphatase MutT (NUDIX family)
MEIKDKELHRIATTAIIYKDDGIYLITKRGSHKKVHPDKWTVPGGGLNTDDYINTPETHKGQWYYSVTNGLIREVKEETGLEIEDIRYLLDLTFIRTDGIPILVLSYYAKYKSGEVVLDEDATEFAWVTAEQAKSYDLIEGISEEIEMVDKILKKNSSS